MTRVEVLSNGRLFSHPEVAQEILKDLTAKVQWLIPLYGHSDFLHDFVVQSPGAFDETIAGLLALQNYGQSVQLRVVLIRPVLENIDELCSFIGRNLPFISMLALMACEPIGFALANREHCEVDLADWGDVLSVCARILNRFQIPFIFMNFPLCGLPKPLWRNAQRSISDWKNSYAEECIRCSVKNECSGLFAWYERGWKPTRIKAIREADREQIH
jgi:His-Xaa-Ser system radical SAM maturase HxsC